MKIKDFFRSVTFKCIVVLSCIAVCSGAILSLLNDLLYVSDAEILQRAINKIYNEEPVIVKEEIDLSSLSTKNEYGTINVVYEMDNGHYLVNATGTGGYKNGTVTVYTAFTVENDALTGIYKIVVSDNQNQSYISNIDAAYLAKYVNSTEVVQDGGYFTTDSGYMVTGATQVSNATNNAVNAGLYFMRTQIFGGERT